MCVFLCNLIVNTGLPKKVTPHVCRFGWNVSTFATIKIFNTLMQKTRDQGIVKMTKRALRPVKNLVQGPGPVGSAVKYQNH